MHLQLRICKRMYVVPKAVLHVLFPLTITNTQDTRYSGQAL